VVTSNKSEHGPALTEPAPNQQPIEEVDVALSKRTTPPAFQFYASDFLSSDKVSRMSLAEIGVYITLCHAWLAHGLPNDHAQIARYVRLPTARLKRLWTGPLGECFVLKGGRLVNPRQERIRVDLMAFIEKQKANGKLGGRPRKPTDNPPDNPNDNPDETQTLATPNPNKSSSVSSLQSSVFSTQKPIQVSSSESVEPPSDSSPAVLEFHTVGLGGSLWTLTEAQVNAWVTAFPNVDVEGECRRAFAWLEAQPSRRKTPGGMPRFLVSWLNRAADRGGHAAPAASKTAGNLASLQNFVNRGR
jgi:hypothetical protein